MQLSGIHHLTAVSARIRDNHRFFTRALGMRLVKRSVNQDDVRAYHLFYADARGTPGTDLTFFDWPVPAERRGTSAVVRTSLRVAGVQALEWWARRLRDARIAAGEAVERDGRLTIDFEDPEGQRLSLVDDGWVGDAHTWDRSTVPAAYQIRGLGANGARLRDGSGRPFLRAPCRRSVGNAGDSAGRGRRASRRLSHSGLRLRRVGGSPAHAGRSQ